MRDTAKHQGLRNLLAKQLEEKGITDKNVLEAIKKIPRHLFLNSSFEDFAYQDKAFPIGAGQTISQPYTVAFQSELLQVKRDDKILEIGTGSGYQTAVLVAMGAKVYTIESVIKRLKFYNQKVKLSERIINTGFEISDAIFNQEETGELIKGQNPYEKNVILKCIIKKKYEALTNSIDLDFWIINNWGGIRGFKKNKKNLEKINVFKKQIVTGNLSLNLFSTISSLSKISAFMNPDEYVIYDSRVIFTLNWLILTCENKDGFKQKYFPMPIGRNKIISDFNINTLININHSNEYRNKKLYYNPNEAYHIYCKLIKNIAKILFGENSNPYNLELLLFVLADKEIFDEIINKTSISFNYYL